jgi:hypothetical protein
MILVQDDILSHPTRAVARHTKLRAQLLKWIDAVDKVGDEVANALICVFVDGLIAAPVGGATRSFSRLMANTTNAVRRGTPPTGLSAAARFDLQAS